jgi:hypothetical protein
MSHAFSPGSENYQQNWRNSAMSWHKITLPLKVGEIDPKVVEIGNLAKACYERENKPAGFGMFHATRGENEEEHDTIFIYFSPVAAEVCRTDIGELYTLEPCEVPARDEPHMAWVFGDPLVMGMLADKWDPEKEKAQAAS